MGGNEQPDGPAMVERTRGGKARRKCPAVDCVGLRTRPRGFRKLACSPGPSHPGRIPAGSPRSVGSGTHEPPQGPRGDLAPASLPVQAVALPALLPKKRPFLPQLTLK